MRADAEATVSMWQDYALHKYGPLLWSPNAPLETIDPLETIGTEPIHPPPPMTASVVNSFAVLDSNGDAVARGEMAGEPDQFSSAREAALFEAMLVSGTPQFLVIETDSPLRKRTVYYAPLASDGDIIGGLRLDIDQTPTASVLEEVASARALINRALAVVGIVVVFLILWRRIRERRDAEEEIRFLAMHDTLTGLPNRAQFNDRLERAITKARNAGSALAVMCIDVDNFKEINDTFGHPAGDRVLCLVAGRILAASSPGTTVARLSGDEFAVLIEHVRDVSAARRAAKRYVRGASLPHDIEGKDLVCTLSVGVALSPADGGDAETVMKNADLALYAGKADGRNTVRFFTSEMEDEVRQRRLMEEDMRKGVAEGQFHLCYQPQVDFATGRVSGMEALARWSHPELGDVSPATFIPIAESSGMIVPFGEWITRTACVAAAEWSEPVTLAVNLSAAQFLTADIAGMIERALHSSGLPADRLEVEITETALLQATDATRNTLDRLRHMGVRIALDDFGTGYSSLNYLSRFPIDKIKIDRSFVQGIGKDKSNEAIVNAIIGLGKSLDLTVTAEGVETAEQASYLKAAGCHQAQGYLYGRAQRHVAFAPPSIADLRQASG